MSRGLQFGLMPVPVAQVAALFLFSLAVPATRNAKPPQVGDQYSATFWSRRSKLPRSLRVPVMPAMVMSPHGSIAMVAVFHGMSQRPMSTEPQPPCSPTALLRAANVVLFWSGRNAVSSWKKALRSPPRSSVPRTPRRDDWSSMRVRRETGVEPPRASTDSAVTFTWPYRTTGLAVCAMAAGATKAPATARAIRFLFIRISFVEVRPCFALRFLTGTSGGWVPDFSGIFERILLEAGCMMPKRALSLKGFSQQNP